MDKFEQELDQIAEVLEKAGKAGEGSRGGKIIGHTKSGKPIYDGGSTKIPKIGAANKPFPSKDEMKSMQPHQHARAAEDHDFSAHHAIEAGDHETASKHMAMSRAHQAYSGNRANDSEKEEAHSHAEKGGEEHVKKQAKMLVAERKHGRGSPEHREAELEFHDHVGSLGDGPASRMSRDRAASLREESNPYDPSNSNLSDYRMKHAHLSKDDHEAKAKELRSSDGSPKYKANMETLARYHESEAKGNKMKKSYEAIIDTVMALGPEALKKAVPNLTEDQKLLLKEVLEKAKKPVSMDEEMPEGGIEVRQEASEKVKAKRKIDEDEKLVKEKAAKINNQGDQSELEGQVIKSENCEPGEGAESEKEESMSKKMVARMKEKGLKKSECMEAAQKKGNEALTKAIEAFWGEEENLEKGKMKKKATEEADQAERQADEECETEEMETEEIANEEAKQNGKKMEKALLPPPVAIGKEERKKQAAAKRIKKDTDKVDSAKEEEEKTPNPMAKEASEQNPAEMAAQPKKEILMKKSIQWSEGTQALLKASTRRGQNAHYEVQDALIKAEEETAEKIAKGDYLGETGEKLEKASTDKKVTANDLIEKGLDMGQSQIDRIQSLQKSVPNGAFTVKSFEDSDLVKSLGLTEEQASEALKKA